MRTPVTIGIPAYNEAEGIGGVVHAFLQQMIPQDELIVIASACTDGTAEVVRAYNDPRIQVIEESERTGKVSAINTILECAIHDLVVLADADVVIPEDALERIEKVFQNPNTGAVCAKVIPYSMQSFMDRVQGLGWRGLHDQKVREQEEGVFYALNGYLMAVRKRAIGRMDPEMIVDDALTGWTAKKNGYDVIYAEDIPVKVRAAQKIRDFIDQKARSRVGWLQMHQKGMSLTERRHPKQLLYLLKSPYALAYITFDLIAWVVAWRRKKRNDLSWRKITSSKITQV